MYIFIDELLSLGGTATPIKMIDENKHFYNCTYKICYKNMKCGANVFIYKKNKKRKIVRFYNLDEHHLSIDYALLIEKNLTKDYISSPLFAKQHIKLINGFFLKLTLLLALLLLYHFLTTIHVFFFNKFLVISFFITMYLIASMIYTNYQNSQLFHSTFYDDFNILWDRRD